MGCMLLLFWAGLAGLGRCSSLFGNAADGSVQEDSTRILAAIARALQASSVVSPEDGEVCAQQNIPPWTGLLDGAPCAPRLVPVQWTEMKDDPSIVRALTAIKATVKQAVLNLQEENITIGMHVGVVVGDEEV